MLIEASMGISDPGKIMNSAINKYCFCIGFVLAMLYCGLAKAQNLVPNPSFENHNNCPDSYTTPPYYSDVDTFGTTSYTWAYGWVNPSRGTNPGSPDYYDTCAWLNYPSNFFGYQLAHTGTGYMAIYPLWYQDFYAEYIECNLIQELNAGHHYYTSFYVSLSSTGTSFVPDQIGAYFSDTGVYKHHNLSDTSSYHLDFKASVKSPPHQFITDIGTWTKISGVYTSAGNEQWMVLGRFSGDSAGQTNFYQNPANLPAYDGLPAYYFLDDVCVLDMDSATNPITRYLDLRRCIALNYFRKY